MKSPSVLLVSMPWTSLGEPSLGLGVLRAVLDQADIHSRVRHLNLSLLQFLRAPTYLSLANTFALNDFLFSGVFDARVTSAQLRHLRERVSDMLSIGLVDASRHGGVDGVIDRILHLRASVLPDWLSAEADAIASSDFTMLGLTCMFDQTIASLALAKLVRDRRQDILVALGGYALRDPTGREVMQSFSFVDAVCTGEGEPTVVPLANASVGATPLSEVPGILHRTARGDVVSSLPRPAIHMDSSPIPNFDDYFADLERLKCDASVEIDVDTLPFEASRGCWWGQVRHCVFCGIADQDMAYRARSADNVLSALARMSERYGIRSFRFSDYILPHQYFRTLLPELASRRAPYRLACEMKSNSSTGRMELLMHAGFAEVQAGIESFSSDVLRKMDKGVSAALNVQLLVLGKRYGIHVHYNLLYGLPDDDVDAYNVMLEVLPRLFHLDPPLTHTDVQITRFSPLQANPQRFGIASAVHQPAYELIFSRDWLRSNDFALVNFCYYFDRPYESSPKLQMCYRRLRQRVEQWKRVQAERTVELWFERRNDGIVFFDSRSQNPGVKHHFDENTARVYGVLETPKSVDSIAAESGLCVGLVREQIELLDSHALIFKDGQLSVAIALPRHHAQRESNTRAWAVA